MFDWTRGKAFRIDCKVICAKCFIAMCAEDVEDLDESDVIIKVSKPIACDDCGAKITKDSEDAYGAIARQRERFAEKAKRAS
jgi:hypothetical protein